MSATPHSPVDLRGLRFIRPDGSFDLRAILAAARRKVALWATRPDPYGVYGVGRARWATAMRDAWVDAKTDRHTLMSRVELKAEAARIAALPPVERELEQIGAEIRRFEFSDCSSAYIARQQAPLYARAAAIRAAAVH